jgi:NAD(P)-dependent dehydrogenase (short-subunit alcohol dehydrogenase family)
MARVFVTGSADGLGKMAAELLIEQGHKIVLHARSAAHADEISKTVAGAEGIVVGDLSGIAETKSVADQVNKLGGFDAVIHNAGIGYREPTLVKTGRHAGRGLRPDQRAHHGVVFGAAAARPVGPGLR